MKKKKIQITESALLSKENLSQIKGGERIRNRVTTDDGTKLKFKNIL